jgi:hypothetical protein
MFRTSALASFINRRTTFDTQYSGGFTQHPQLASLNSYDQRVQANASHQFNRRTTWSVRHLSTITPTTELVELVGVPFRRVGVHREDMRTGVDVAVGRLTTVGATYQLQWIDFKDDSPGTPLVGGNNHGGNFKIRHALSPRLALTGEYDLQQARVQDGNQFATHNSWGGVSYRFSEHVEASGAAGASHLRGLEGREPQSGPAVRLGLSRTTPEAQLSVNFSKSYVPSYGFGGTTDNEELTMRLHAPVAQRFVTNASFSLRRNEPLDQNIGYSLRSLWVNIGLSYLATDWMRIEGFSAVARQMSDQVDGRINRYQFGVQVTAAKTTRIR